MDIYNKYIYLCIFTYIDMNSEIKMSYYYIISYCIIILCV